MNKLFGTDGIRGTAGDFPLTPKDVYALGRAAGAVLKLKTGKNPCRLIVVRDTRSSGAAIFRQLAKGLGEQGVYVFDGGVLCTPAVACLVRTHGFDSGAVISASHNPPEFNGIKFFTDQGRKWPDEWEALVEKKFYVGRKSGVFGAAGAEKGAIVLATHLYRDYENFLIDTLGDGADFSSVRITLDCSNGANSHVAPQLFRQLGAQVQVINNKPNGKNINVDCGSQHTEKLAACVRRNRSHLGIAFDGDGDRVIFVDEKGNTIDGDYTIAILARSLKEKERLNKNLVVITVMANLGLKLALSRMKVRTLEVAVGDRYVSAAMKKSGAVLGGEQSGHVILGDFLPTGDGLLTALHVVAALIESEKPFSKLSAEMKKFPQVLLNVPVREKTPVNHLDGVAGKIKSVQRHLGKNGRVLVRYSGTEPLLRIMLEGPDKKKLKSFADDIARLVVAAQP